MSRTNNRRLRTELVKAKTVIAERDARILELEDMLDIRQREASDAEAHCAHDRWQAEQENERRLNAANARARQAEELAALDAADARRKAKKIQDDLEWNRLLGRRW